MKRCRLKDIAEIQVGYQARKRIRSSSDGTHYLIQGKDFDEDGVLDTGNLVKFTPKRNPRLYSVQQNDILLQSRGMEHNALFIHEVPEHTLAAGSFYIIRVFSPEILPRFLCWWLNQTDVQAYLDAHSGGATISYVPKKAAASISIAIPPQETQQKIEKIIILSAHERVLTRRLLELREKLTTAVCTQAIEEREND